MLDAEEIVVTGTGNVYRAPVSTVFPRIGATPGEPWVNLGYCSEAGAAFSFGRDVNPIMGWQAFDPLRIVVKTVPKSVKTELLQWNEHTQLTALGGGAWGEVHAGEFEYSPPDESFVDEFAYIVEGFDGDFKYRFCFARVMVNDKVDFSFVRSDPVMFPISIGVLAAPDGGRPYFVQTDDDHLGDASVASS